MTGGDGVGRGMAVDVQDVGAWSHRKRHSTFSACALTFGLVVCLVGPAAAQKPRAFDDGSWRALLKAHAGRLTIVHFWGISCGTCRVDMARWGALIARRHDFDFVTVDTGIVGKPGDASELLATAGVSDKEAWRFKNGFDETIYKQVDPTWKYEIPMTVLVDETGRVQRLADPTDLKTVDTWLDGKDKLVR